MNNIVLYLILVGVGLLIPIIMFIISRISKKKEEKTTNGFTTPSTPPQDEPHPNVVVTSKDYNLFKQFMAEYGDDDYAFNNLKYRLGAAITGSFGLTEGFRMTNSGMEWGYVRIHTGVDRANGGDESFDWSKSPIRDIVRCPFHFEKSRYTYYGNKSYGTLVQLFNFTFGFEMRIAHMHPTDFVAWSLQQFQEGNKFGKNWVIGSAGNFGASSGAHTHTEFKSLDESCEVFEILLEEQFGDKVHKEYSSSEIIRLYKKYKQFQNASERDILKDWEEIKKSRKAYFVNKYLYRYTDWDGKNKTRYSSEYLFNGL